MQENNCEYGYEQIKKGFEWAEKALKSCSKNSFEKRKIRDELWFLLYDNQNYYISLFKGKMQQIGARYDEGEFADCFFKTITVVLNNYDAEKGNLEHFFNKQWFYRLKDKANAIKNREIMEETIDKDKEENEKGKKRKKEIETPVSIDERIETEDNLADVLVELLNAITHLNEHRTGKTTKKTYFKMFFTDFITEYCKNFEIGWAMKNREKSIFDGLEIDFLDFYMRERCRTLKRIQSVPLKSMQEIKEVGSDEEIKLPLPNQVYIIYLGLASSANVSQKRKEYREFCKQLDIRKKLID